MPRHNHVYWRDGKVVVAIDSIEHTLSESGFIAFMQQALNVMQTLARRDAGVTTTDRQPQ